MCELSVSLAKVPINFPATFPLNSPCALEQLLLPNKIILMSQDGRETRSEAPHQGNLVKLHTLSLIACAALLPACSFPASLAGNCCTPVSVCLQPSSLKHPSASLLPILLSLVSLALCCLMVASTSSPGYYEGCFFCATLSCRV